MNFDRLREIFRYAATGVVSVALNILVVATLTEVLGLNYLLSISICFITVTLVSFCLNRAWTFRKAGARPSQDLLRYVLVTLLQLVLSLVSCGICVDVLHIQYPFAMALTSVLFVPLTYLLHRRWSFSMKWLEQ